MQAKSSSIAIACPLHPSEYVQRVNIDLDCEQQLYCLECILKCTEAGDLPTGLRTINDLVNQTADIYAQRKKQVQIAGQVPDQYGTLLSNQNERLEELGKHIEDQKQQVIFTFDELSRVVLNIIDNKKNEYLNELDKQLFNLRYWYIYMDKQIKKNYPSAEDIPFLFPSKEDLQSKLQKLSNITQLTALVRNLKEDLAESRSIRPTLSENARQSPLEAISKKLATVETVKPYYQPEEGYDLSVVREELKESLEQSLENLLVLQNPVEDVTSAGNCGSKLLNGAQFNMVKGWLPKNSKSNWKLLYRGSKDGKDKDAFHKKCDNQGATVTILKTKLNGKTSLIGGYLGGSWNSTSQYINSSESFIFNVTNKKKSSKPTYNEYAGYGGPDRGPMFGAGDICIMFSSNSSTTHTYAETSQIVGGTGFELLDIEVYKV